MESICKEIKLLITQTGLSASQIAHLLSCVGGGDMQEGIKRIAEYFNQYGNNSGFRKGLGVGVGISVISIFLISYARKEFIGNKKLQEQGTEILNKLQEGWLTLDKLKVDSLMNSQTIPVIDGKQPDERKDEE